MTDVQQQQEIIKEFFDAIQQGEYETVEELLVELITSGIDINTQDEDGNTALHKAVSYNNNGKFCNNDEIVELLVKNGAKIDVLNARGQTAIDIARDFNNDTIVEFLAYILKNQQQEIIERIKELANERKYEEAIELIKGIKDINMSDKYGNFLLHWAVIKRHKLIVEELLKREDIDINATDEYGNTALNIAILKKNDINIVKLLVDNEADINVKNKKNITPYERALLVEELTGEHDIANYLRSKKQELKQKQQQNDQQQAEQTDQSMIKQQNQIDQKQQEQQNQAKIETETSRGEKQINPVEVKVEEKQQPEQKEEEKSDGGGISQKQGNNKIPNLPK